MFTRIRKVSLASFAMTLCFATYAFAETNNQQPTAEPGRVGRWDNNANNISQSASISKGSNGSLNIGIAIAGQNPGESQVHSSARPPVIEAPRGGSRFGNPGLSIPPVSWGTTPSNGGANTIVPGPSRKKRSQTVRTRSWVVLQSAAGHWIRQGRLEERQPLLQLDQSPTLIPGHSP